LKIVIYFGNKFNLKNSILLLKYNHNNLYDIAIIIKNN